MCKEDTNIWPLKKINQCLKHTSCNLIFIHVSCRHVWFNFTVFSWLSVAFKLFIQNYFVKENTVVGLKRRNVFIENRTTNELNPS